MFSKTILTKCGLSQQGTGQSIVHCQTHHNNQIIISPAESWEPIVSVHCHMHHNIKWFSLPQNPGHMFVACLCPLSHASQQSNGSLSCRILGAQGRPRKHLKTSGKDLDTQSFWRPWNLLRSFCAHLNCALLNGFSCIFWLLDYLGGFWTLNAQH